VAVKPLPRWFRRLVRIASIIPPLGTAIAWRLFWTLGAPVSVRPSERDTHDRARVGSIDVDGDAIATYEWGTGQRTVLLVHGWRSRASRFSVLIDELVERGFTVVSFDAPGNGDSGGTRMDALQVTGIVQRLAAQYGPLEAIVGHSFGGMPTFMARRNGTDAARLITIASAHNFSAVIDMFAAGIGLPSTRGLRRRSEAWGHAKGIDIWRTALSELDPTDTGTPILVVHDAGDREVPLEQAMLIVEAHTGPVETMITDGLGHNRVLSDPDVVGRIAAFVSGSVRAEPRG
jgi:pimeloyl-ACP methyl ester carboxylesterase